MRKLNFFWLLCCCFASYCKLPLTATIPFNHKALFFQGRVLHTGEAAVLSWPGSSVTINFEGTEIKVECSETGTSNYYNVILDGKVVAIKKFTKARQVHVLASGLSNGRHQLQLFKRTESDKGKTFLYGFSGNNIKVLPASALPGRKIEFYGNSISCGAAIEDAEMDRGDGVYQNNYNAYPAITARHFNAQYQCIAKSGIGITVSWFPLIMKEMYNRQEETDAKNLWDFKRYCPDIVVVNLLQNDYWLTQMKEHEQYKFRFAKQAPTPEFIMDEYKNFVQLIRNEYPAANIICMLGNMDITHAGSAWPGYVTRAAEALNDPKIFTLFVPYKNTAGHPKTREQQVLADSLIAFISTNINW